MQNVELKIELQGIEFNKVDLTPDNVRRPDEVQVDYEVIDPATGNVVYDPSLIVFENRGGQAFDTNERGAVDNSCELLGFFQDFL